MTFDGTGITLGGTTWLGAEIHVTVGGLYFNGKCHRWYHHPELPVGRHQFLYSHESSGTSGADPEIFTRILLRCQTKATGMAEGQFYIYQGTGESFGTRISMGQISGGTASLPENPMPPATGYTVSYCTATNHKGGSNESCGVGFKAQNSQITIFNCTAYNNYRGWDPGDTRWIKMQRLLTS